MMSKKFRTAIYSRVSTAEQASEGYSIGVQKEKLQQYAAAMSYDVFDVYSDEAFSGKTLSRPALEKMIADIRAGRIDIVLIYKLDRLSRRVKDVLELVELFEKYSVTLYSLNENLDLSSPFGRAALKMSATFSELERETILERMQMGKNARAKAGKYSCPGKVPFGYRAYENDTLIVHEPEAEAIRKIFELYVNHGFTFRKLYDYCKEAYPDIKYFSNPMCCKPLIKRPMYAGYFRYKDELIKGSNFPAIIDYETFLQAQAHVEINRFKRSIENSPYLLTGLAHCSQCGNRYVGKLYDRYSYKPDGSQTKRYQYRSYGCAARVKRDKKYHHALCENEIIPAHKLEEYIEKYIKQITFSDYAEGTYVPGFIDSLMAENSALKIKKNKLLDLYLDGSIDKETFTMRLVEIEAKLTENKTIIETEINKVQAAPVNSVKVLQDKLKNYDNLSRKDKSLLLKFLIKSIVINGQNITINLSMK